MARMFQHRRKSMTGGTATNLRSQLLRPSVLLVQPSTLNSTSILFASKSAAVPLFSQFDNTQMSLFSTGTKDYYRLLGVKRSATEEEIKKAYIVKAKQLHPDLNPSPNAKQQFQELGEAYSVLKDPMKRRDYDRGTYDSQNDARYNRTGTSSQGPSISLPLLFS